MQAEGPDARAQEKISCSARDLACARLVEMRGEACALTANDARLPAQTRAQRRQCALSDTQSLPGLMPSDAPKEDQDRAALLVFDSWRAARDGRDPGATPAALSGAVAALSGMPGGRPYANALAADNLVYAVLTGTASKETECGELRQSQQLLPAAEPGSQLADRVDSLKLAIRSASTRRGCAA